MTRLALGLFVAGLVSVSAAAPSPPPLRCADDPPLKDNLKKIQDDLKGKDAKKVSAAIDQAAKLGEEAEPLTKDLCLLTLHKNQTVALAALTSLEKVNPTLYKPLAKFYLDRSDSVKAEGLAALGRMGDEAVATVPILLSRMLTPRPDLGGYIRGDWLQEEAFKALQKIAPDDETVLAGVYSLASGKVVCDVRLVLAARKRHIEWAGDDVDKRKKVLPLIKQGFAAERGPEPWAMALAAEYGVQCKEYLPLLKKLKLADDQRTREAATKAVEMIEAAVEAEKEKKKP